MKFMLSWLVLTISFALALGAPSLTVAQNQVSTPASPNVKRGSIQHHVQLQLLVTSNNANTKTDYPSLLEPVVNQLKSILPFKNHRLVATYLYNVADGSRLDTSDVTYMAFEPGSGLSPTFFKLEILDIKLNADGDSIHMGRFTFEVRRRILVHKEQTEVSNTGKPIFDSVSTGISTELTVKAGTPTIVGTTVSALSNGLIVLVVTVKHSGMR